MRQDFIGQDFTRCLAPRGVSASVLVCVVLASGAAFGMAAQSVLHHFGLDFASIHNDLIANHAAKPRSALAWWAWWLVALAAFLVGPSSAALTRVLVANWWRMRAVRLCVTAVAVLGLAAIGQLPPAPSTLAFTTTAVLGLLVIAASTLLAALGARVLGSLLANAGPAGLRVPDRTCAPLPVTPPWRGGGSAVSGLPFLRFRERHPLAPGPFSVARLALASVLALVVLAAVSVLGGATALLDVVAPGAVRELVASWLPPAGADSRARTLVLVLLPVEPRTRVVMPPVALLDAPPPKPVEAPEPRQRAISASAGPPESELTFTKGYSRRHAAQLAANMTSLPSIPRLTAAINIKKIRAASLRFTQDRRLNRPVADNRYFGDNRNFTDNRYFADNRRFTDDRTRAARHARGRNRHVDRQGRYADRPARYADYNTYDTYDRHSRHWGGRELQ